MSCLHDRDLFLWSEEQNEFLRNREFEKLDIEHIIEELDIVGKSDQHALYSYLVVLITHLLKKEYQPGMLSNSWLKSIMNSRGAILDILDQHPSLRKILSEKIEKAYIYGRKTAILETGLKSEVFPKENPFSIEFLLTDEN